MKGVANWCRTNLKRNSISVGYKDHLQETSSSLADLYHLNENVLFDGEGDQGEVKRPVVWANCEEVLERVCTDRNYVGTPT